MVVFHSFVSLPEGKSEFKHRTIHATTPRIRSGMPCSKMCCTTKLALDSLFFGPDPKVPDKFLRFSRSLVVSQITNQQKKVSHNSGGDPAKHHVDQHFLHQTIRTNHQEIPMSGCTNKDMLHQFLQINSRWRKGAAPGLQGLLRHQKVHLRESQSAPAAVVGDGWIWILSSF